MSIQRSLAYGLMSAFVVLSGCGGGGSDSAPPVTELPPTVTITSVTSAEVGTAAAFSSNVSGATDGLTFAWAFGDGSTSTAAAPTHAYARGGDYVVTLSVTNQSGVTRSSSSTISAGHYALVQGANCTGASNTGWCWQRPLPTGSAMLDMTFVDAANGWAVGEAGQILKTTDGGATWSGQRSGVSARLTQVRFADLTTGWALGDNGIALKTADGGATWVAQAPGLSYPSWYANDGLTVFDGSRAVLRTVNESRSTSDGGVHWINSLISPTVTTANGTIWSNESYSITKSLDLGATKSTSLSATGSNAAYFQGLSFSDDAHGWVYGTAFDFTSSTYISTLSRTTDAGASWQQMPTPGGGYGIAYLKFTSANVGWIQNNGGVYRTIDAGTSWTALTLPAGVQSYYYYGSVEAFDDATFWMPYGNGGYLTRNGGASWTQLQVDTELYTQPIKLRRIGGALLIDFGTRVYRSSDDGATWKQVLGQEAADKDGSLLASWFFDATKGLAYSSSGALISTSDGGRSWTRKAITTAGYGAARLQFASATTGWLLSTGNGVTSISATTDGGASWLVPLTAADFAGTTDFHFVDDRNGWSVTSSGVVNHSSDGGLSWTAQAKVPYYYLLGVRFASADVGVVVGGNGTIARTADGGATWTLRASGVLANLRRVKFVDANVGWAVGELGTVLKTTDAGLTWTKVAVPSFTNFNDIMFTDAQHGWIVGESGAIVATADGGRNWQLQASGTDKALMSAFFVDPRTGWLVGAGGSVLVTATGGN